MESIVVDYAYKGPDWVKGFVHGNPEPVYTASGVVDLSAVKLYGKDGKPIAPTVAPPTEGGQLRADVDLLLIAELQREGIL